MPEEEQERRLFVCVKDRGGKGASCAGRGALALIREMRKELAKEDIPAAELDVRPAGCMDLCKRGPVMLAVTGAAAGERKPPKLGRKKRKGAEGATLHTLVEPGELRSLLRSSLATPAVAPHARSRSKIAEPGSRPPTEPDSQPCTQPGTQPHTQPRIDASAGGPSLEE